MNNTFHDRGLYENEIYVDLTNAFVEYESKYRGYIISTTLLGSRVKGILKMVRFPQLKQPPLVMDFELSHCFQKLMLTTRRSLRLR